MHEAQKDLFNTDSYPFTIIYAQEAFPKSMTKSIYLAGPSPRKEGLENWREDTLNLLAKNGYDGVVYVPLPRDGKFPKHYNTQALWEQEAMNRSDIILFWVPRDLTVLKTL